VSAAAVVLLPPASGAAARPFVGWTKTWAEDRLRLHFDATTVACLPLGAATRANGTSSFKEFVCGLVLADGARLTIHLRPRSRTTWTTVSMKVLGPNPGKKKNVGRGSGGGGGNAGGGGANAGGGPPVHDTVHGHGNGKND
jgi:uncharacterized membrane protein YgcG